MFIVTVTFAINPDNLEGFLPVMRQQAQTSLRDETGCHQFDVCQSSKNPCEIFLYEAYEDKNAFDLHLRSDHFLKFDRTVAPWVADKRLQTFERIAP